MRLISNVLFDPVHPTIEVHEDSMLLCQRFSWNHQECVWDTWQLDCIGKGEHVTSIIGDNGNANARIPPTK